MVDADQERGRESIGRVVSVANFSSAEYIVIIK